MSKRKSTIPKTNLYEQIIHKFNIHIAASVFNQIDRDLRWSSWNMIVTPVHSATLRSLDEDNIRDIMELL